MFVWDEEQKEMQDSKKKALQEQFLRHIKNNKEKNTPETTTDVDLTTKYETEKKKRKEAEKKVAAFDKKAADYQEEIAQLKQKLNKEKESSYQLQQSTNEFRNELKQRDLALQKSQVTIQKLEAKNIQLKESTNAQKIAQLEKAKKRMSERNVSLTLNQKVLKEELKTLRSKLQGRNILKNAEKDTAQAQLVANLTRKNQTYKERLEQFEQGMTPQFLLKLLDEAITMKNVSKFFYNQQNQLEVLAGKVDLLKLEKRYKRQNKNKKKSSPILLSPSVITNERIGYVINNGNTWNFIDIYEPENGQSGCYEVVQTGMSFSLINDQPVKVRIEDNKATVLKVYKEIPKKKMTTSVKKVEPEKTNLVEKPIEETVYPAFGDVRVLIIGSQYLHHYRDRLVKHGVTVELHHAFEENEKRIDDKINRADVVLVCTSHISHSVMNHLDDTNAKIQYIEKDTEEVIVARTRFTLVNLGLLTIHNYAETFVVT